MANVAKPLALLHHTKVPTAQCSNSSALLNHLEGSSALGSANKSRDIKSTLDTLAVAEDIALLAWAVADFSCSLANDPQSIPQGSVDVIARRLQSLDLGPMEKKLPLSAGAAAKEEQAQRWRLRQQRAASRVAATSALLQVLQDLVRVSPDDKIFVKELIMEGGTSNTSWLGCLLRVMCECASDGTEIGCSTAFANGCHLLLHLTRGDPEVAKMLIQGNALQLIGDALCRLSGPPAGGSANQAQSHTKDLTVDPAAGSDWLPSATAAVSFLDVLVTEEDTERFTIANPVLYKPTWSASWRPITFVDGCIYALTRDLVGGCGSMVVQQLHLSGLRALQRAAYLSNDMAHRVICNKGLSLGVQVLKIPGVDEEAAIVILMYFATLAASCPNLQRQLLKLGVDRETEQLMSKYSWSASVQKYGDRVLKACGK